MSIFKRNSNLELYRIIVMLLIVAHHYVVNSGLMERMQDSPLSPQSIFYYLFGAWGKTGINCFVLITGYFMCKSRITSKKFFKLLFEVLFYNIVIYSIFVLSGYEDISISTLENLIPARNLTTNFVSCFLVFYLCIPFLNILIHNLDKKKHLLLICLSLFIYTVHGTVPHTYVTMNYVSWFIVLYFISSYLRLYPNKYDMNIQFWRGGVFLCIILSVLSIIAILWLNENYDKNIPPYKYVSDSNAILALSVGICSFMYFKNLNIKYSKLINTTGASIFGVLLIHANSDTMRKWLWQDVFNNIGHYYDDFFWLRAIIVTLIVFLGCITIDFIRIKLIDLILKTYERFI